MLSAQENENVADPFPDIRAMFAEDVKDTISYYFLQY